MLNNEKEKHLQKRNTRAVIWRSGEMFFQTVIQFVISVILARTLLPADYGLIGVSSVLIALLATLVDSGVQNALIQKKDVTEVDYCSGFYFNFAISIVVYAICFLSAPWISIFFVMPPLSTLLRVNGLLLFFACFRLIPQVILERAIRAKENAIINSSTMTLSGIAGIIAALSGWGVWSLLVASLGNIILQTIFLCLWVRWRPRWLFSWGSLNHLLCFGINLSLSSFFRAICQNLTTVGVGKFYGQADLGYYTRANSFRNVLLMTLNSIVFRSSFPIFAEAQHDNTILKHRMDFYFRMVSEYCFPLIGLFIVGLKPLLIILFTEKWLPALPICHVLAVVGFFLPLFSLGENVLIAKGHPGTYLKIEMILKISLAIGLVCTLFGGLVLIAWSEVIGFIVSLFVCLRMVKKHTGYSIMRLGRIIMPGTIVCFLATLAGCVGFTLNNPYLQCVVIGGTFVMVFLLTGYYIKLTNVQFLSETVRTYWNRKTAKQSGSC